MKALILAAGSGTRLGSPLPKAFQKIGETTVFQRTICNLAEMGIERKEIQVVTGFRGELFQETGIKCIPNRTWRFPGTLSSFFAAEDLSEEVLVIHGDLVWETCLLQNLRNFAGDITVPIDPGSRLAGEAMKAEVRCGRVLHLSKNLTPCRSAGESMGVFLIKRPHRLREISRHILWKPHATLDDAVNIAAGEITVKAFFTESSRWEEIDTPGDLRRAKDLFE